MRMLKYHINLNLLLHITRITTKQHQDSNVLMLFLVL
jgi:hypothetical protein